MKKGTTKIGRDAITPLLALIFAWPAGTLPVDGATAPQDSNYPAVKTIQAQQPDDGGFYQPVLRKVAGVDLVYYEFADSTNLRRGIRARDLDGNLVYEILSPGYSQHDVNNFAVAPDGTIYATERRASVYRVHIYTLSGASYSETGSFGPDGPVGADFSSSLTTYGQVAVSPVSGKVFVKESYVINNTDPVVNGQLRVYDAAGNFLTTLPTNNILAPSLEGSVRGLHVVEGHDGTGEVWVRGNYGTTSSVGTYSKWFKVFTEAGSLKRLFDVGSTSVPLVAGDLMYLGNTNTLSIIPLAAESAAANIGQLFSAPFGSGFEGRDSLGRIVDVTTGASGEIRIYEQPVFRTFDPRAQNAIPNPIVTLIQQRPGFTILDLDYRVEDSDDATVTTAALAFPDGNASVLNALPLTTFADGTEAKLGAGISTNTRHRLSWNAGSDWNVDFGDISVMVLARDSRTYWFDVHLVDIPADGLRPAVTISRNPLDETDFTAQWLWLIATSDPSISITGGIITGTDATYNGLQLTDAQGNSTADGRAFLLARDGLRVATAAEVTRAREGATEGSTPVNLTPPQSIKSSRSVRPALPFKINEYGIESYNSNWAIGVDYRPTSQTLWHVVPVTSP